jgi:hypothetical protein
MSVSTRTSSIRPIHLSIFYIGRSYWMSRKLCLTILVVVCDHDTTGKLGSTSYRKHFITVCIPAYGVASDLVDECPCARPYALTRRTISTKAVVPMFNKLYPREPKFVDSRVNGLSRVLRSKYCMYK